MIICDNERLDESSFLVSRVRLKRKISFALLNADEDAKSRPIIRKKKYPPLDFITTPFFRVRDCMAGGKKQVNASLFVLFCCCCC